MNTAWLLAARYEGLPVIPLERVRQDFFPDLSQRVFLARLADAKIPLPVVRLASSQKSGRGIPLQDLASYIDAAAEKARRELRAMAS
ncbi:pyocin activator PrtN family protein [Pseudooceanicola antarcticus]|nr:pyocin activator PrtN family protein [Pseudooceanicola antarcticus]PJE26496.1 Pyocin activator protein PrtN [Pseudooceanicola antarcticus]